MVYYTKTDLVALALTALAFAFNAAGTFSKAWWADRSSVTTGLFSHVVCENSVCHFSQTETEGWITAAQTTALTQFLSLIVSLVLHLLNICVGSERVFMRFLTIVALGSACFFAHLHTFLLINVYSHLSEQYYSQIQLPANYAFYLTLPVGFNAISGVLSIGPLLALIVVHTKEKKAQQEAQGVKDGPKGDSTRPKATVV